MCIQSIRLCIYTALISKRVPNPSFGYVYVYTQHSSTYILGFLFVDLVLLEEAFVGGTNPTPHSKSQWYVAYTNVYVRASVPMPVASGEGRAEQSRAEQSR